MEENRFNLIDEAWIPVTQKGLVSLKQIFSDKEISALGGTPVEKISVLKLLLAIAQSAYTPKDEEDWSQLGPNGMCNKVLHYLNEHYDAFWLYGEKPFLQMPEIEKKIEDNEKNQSLYKFGNGAFPDLFPDNNTILTEIDSQEISSDDAKKAIFLISVMNFALKGKQVNSKIILAENKDMKKPAVAQPGPSIGKNCYLHAFISSKNLINTIYYSLFTNDNIKNYAFWSNGIGRPFWEEMPKDENCMVANNSKKTFLGALVPMSRFMLFKNGGLYFTEGIIYPSFKDGWIEPTFIWNAKKSSILLASTEKKPWRNLSAILSFMASEDYYDCLIIKQFVSRIAKEDSDVFSIWSGGLSVAYSDPFGQKPKDKDTYVDSEIQLSTAIFKTADKFYQNLKQEMEYMDQLDNKIKKCVQNYFDSIANNKNNSKAKSNIGKKYASIASSLYWQFCERSFPDLVDACSDDPTGEKARAMRRIFEENAYKAFDLYCPNQTARQLEVWASTRPRF
jgi:CRISPR system Cascade subunit CasA